MDSLQKRIAASLQSGSGRRTALSAILGTAAIAVTEANAASKRETPQAAKKKPPARGPQGPSGPQGARGPQGPAGPKGDTGVFNPAAAKIYTYKCTWTGGTDNVCTIFCPDGTAAVNGGLWFTPDLSKVWYLGDFPTTDKPDEWRVWFDTTRQTGVPYEATIWAQCVPEGGVASSSAQARSGPKAARGRVTQGRTE